MRIAYLDCFAGLSGDMFLAALIGAGVDPAVLHGAASAMNLGAKLEITTVDRSGISSIKVNVVVADATGATKLADAPTPADTVQHQHQAEPHTHQPETQHLHKAGHAHTHEPHTHEPHTHEHEPATHTHEADMHEHGPATHTQEHAHGRSLSVIRRLITDSSLDAPVKRTAIRAFELLGTSEAKIHNVPVEKIHFHEVGAVDAIIDIVAASAGIHALAADRWLASPINVGSGMVDCAHGRFPVPAPATADLLREMPTYSAHLQNELVTPTGAALLRVLVEEKSLTFATQPAMRVQQIGYGAGSRNPKDFPNVLRLLVGTSTESAVETQQQNTVTVIETALDDQSPQLIAHVAERALALGALDVMLTPVLMKKGRPGTLVTLLANPEDSPRLEDLLLAETSTLGLRIRHDRRITLDRSFTPVDTSYGRIQIKLGSRHGEALNANPEFEDCRKAAAEHNVPVKQVHQAAIAAYAATLKGLPHD